MKIPCQYVLSQTRSPKDRPTCSFAPNRTSPASQYSDPLFDRSRLPCRAKPGTSVEQNPAPLLSRTRYHRTPLVDPFRRPPASAAANSPTAVFPEAVRREHAPHGGRLYAPSIGRAAMIAYLSPRRRRSVESLPAAAIGCRRHIWFDDEGSARDRAPVGESRPLLRHVQPFTCARAFATADISTCLDDCLPVATANTAISPPPTLR